jgi:iron complex transport system substrate-binding protein
MGERSREASWEDMAAANPDVVVLGLCGFDLNRTVDEWAAFAPPKSLTTTSAWSRSEVWAIDGSAYISRPGPRLVDGIEVLAAILAGRPDARAIRLPIS